MKKIQIKNFLILGAIIVIVASVIFVFKNKNSTPEGRVFAVKRENIIHSISETGTIEQGDEIELSFKLSGTINQILTKEGEKVKKNQLLARLDDQEILLQLEQAEADLELFQSQLDKLLAGASKEDIKLQELKVAQADIAYQDASNALEQAKEIAQSQLDSYYQTALNYLKDALLKINNVSIFIASLQKNYFYRGDQESLTVKYKKQKIEEIYQELADYLNKINQQNDNSQIDVYLPIFKERLEEVQDSLAIVKDATEEPAYQNLISSTDKTTLDNHRSYINSVLSNISSSYESIELQKSINQQNILKAEQAKNSAYYQLEQAKEALNKLKSPPREEDVRYYQAQIEKAKKQIELLKTKIENTKIKAPVDAIVVAIRKQAGESVQPFEPIIVLLPDNPFYVEVNIYEEDISKISLGDKVEIQLVAQPEQTINGEVYFISPKEILINEVVYYPIKISFSAPDFHIKPGMSADVSIILDKKENVLAVPNEALIEENGHYFVLIKKDQGTEKKEIKIGMTGSNDMVEVIEGLNEGEEVIIPD